MPQTEYKLSPKQKLFAQNYAKSKNATQAAIDAGYSKKTAKSIGSENLTKPDIQEYLNELYSEAIGNAPQGTIATIEEIFAFHTSVMRGNEEGATITEKQRSANSLYEMLSEHKEENDNEGGVIILAEVNDYE
jgi:phage terminase small subunit